MAVLGLVRIARCVVFRPITPALLNDTQLIVLQRLRAHHLKQRLVNTEINVLAFAATLRIAMIEREHGRKSAVGGGDAVC